MINIDLKNKKEIEEETNEKMAEQDFIEIDRDITKILIEMKKEKDSEKENKDEDEKDLNNYNNDFFSTINLNEVLFDNFNQNSKNSINDNINNKTNKNKENLKFKNNNFNNNLLNINQYGSSFNENFNNFFNKNNFDELKILNNIIIDHTNKIENNFFIGNKLTNDNYLNNYNFINKTDNKMNNIFNNDNKIFPLINNNLNNNINKDIMNEINIENNLINNNINDNCLNKDNILNYNEKNIYKISQINNNPYNKNNYFLEMNNNNNINELSNQNNFNSSTSFSVGKNKNGINVDSPKYFIHIENILQGKDKRTTLIIRNIPISYSISKLLRELNKKFYRKYDLVYLPKDNIKNSNLGFGFINFIDYMHLLYFYDLFEGKKWNCFNSNKKCQLAYSKYQGKDKLIEYIHKKLGISTPFNSKDNLKNSFFINDDDEKHPKPLIEIPLKFFNSFKSYFPYSLCHSKNEKIFVVDKYYNF